MPRFRPIPEDASRLQTLYDVNVSAECLVGFDAKRVTDLAAFAKTVHAAVPNLDVVQTYKYFLTVRKRPGTIFTEMDLKALSAIPEFRHIEPNSPAEIIK